MLVELLFIAIAIYFIILLFTPKKSFKNTSNSNIIQKNKYTSNTNTIHKNKNSINNEAILIAKKIKTHKGIEALQNKVDKLLSADDYHKTDYQIEKIETQIEVLYKAIDLAYDNTYRYYYDICEVNTETPLNELKLIGKSISIKKYEEQNEQLKNKFIEITFDEASDLEEANDIAKEDMSKYIKDLIKFRKIIESNIPEQEIAKKFNNLLKNCDYLQDELDIVINDEQTPYAQYLENLK